MIDRPNPSCYNKQKLLPHLFGGAVEARMTTVPVAVDADPLSHRERGFRRSPRIFRNFWSWVCR